MRIYLDHATPASVRSEITQQVAEDLANGFGGWANPSAQCTAGRRVGALLAQARVRLTSALRVDAHEVLPTPGGTEADALVASGRVHVVPGGWLVVSPIEHPVVLDSVCTAADQLGAGLNLLEVDDVGWAGLDSVGRMAALTGRTDYPPASLVSVMMASNETGVVQDMAALVERVWEASGTGRLDEAGYVPVHSDVVAALGKVLADFHGWGPGAMSLTGQKLGAPVGVGVLVARRDLGLTSAMGGGRQEWGLRSGTQDAVAAQALALAVELAVAEREEQKARSAVLRRQILEGAGAPAGVHATLPEDADHVASTVHPWFEEADIEVLLMALDLAGVDASAGSACHAGATQPSHALLAMGFEEGLARPTLRCLLGRETSLDDVEYLFAALSAVPEGLRCAWEVTHKEQ